MFYQQSGNAMMPWAVEYDREKYTSDAYDMGRLAGCDGQYENTREFVACLRDLPWQNITSASNLVSVSLFKQTNKQTNKQTRLKPNRTRQ